VRYYIEGRLPYLVAAIGAIKAVGAEAHVAPVGRVHTGGTVKAGIVGARLLGRSLAAAAMKSSRAVASRVRFALRREEKCSNILAPFYENLNKKLTEQVPPLRQGMTVQSSLTSSQSVPVYSVGQVQV
jgi:hypothetical protein